MDPLEARPVPLAVTRAFVEEVVRTGLLLSGVLADVLDELPDDAFPGEDPAEVLLEMVSASVHPAVQAVGAQEARRATALLGATCDRALGDLRAAADAAAALAREA